MVTSAFAESAGVMPYWQNLRLYLPTPVFPLTPSVSPVAGRPLLSGQGQAGAASLPYPAAYVWHVRSLALPLSLRRPQPHHRSRVGMHAPGAQAVPASGRIDRRLLASAIAPATGGYDYPIRVSAEAIGRDVDFALVARAAEWRGARRPEDEEQDDERHKRRWPNEGLCNPRAAWVRTER